MTNADLLEEIIRFKTEGKVSESLGKMLLTLATHYSTKSNFSGYTWKQDMVSESICTCIKYLRNFNPEKSTNAFAYVTQIVKNSFKLYILEQRKHSIIKDKCFRGYMAYQTDEQNSSYSSQSINYETVSSYVYDDVKVPEEIEVIEGEE